MWAHVHPEERRSPEWVPLILWFLWRDFSWGMALYQQAAQQEERGTPSSRASASPSPKPQCWAQLCSALLRSALPLASWHCHGLLPSGIWHSSTPLCLLGAEHTNHTPALHLILWHWAGSEQPGKEQIWPQLSWYSLLGLLWDLNSYTALILKKKTTDLAGICWGGIGKQMSDCFSNIWKWL